MDFIIIPEVSANMLEILVHLELARCPTRQMTTSLSVCSAHSFHLNQLLNMYPIFVRSSRAREWLRSTNLVQCASEDSKFLLLQVTLEIEHPKSLRAFHGSLHEPYKQSRLHATSMNAYFRFSDLHLSTLRLMQLSPVCQGPWVLLPLLLQDGTQSLLSYHSLLYFFI